MIDTITNGKVTILSATAGDADGNYVVDYEDLIILAVAYGTSTGDELYDIRADFDSDGDVDFDDLSILGMNYGNVCI